MEWKRAHRVSEFSSSIATDRLLEEIKWEIQDNNFLLSQIFDAVKALNPSSIVAGKIVLGTPVPQ